MTEIKCDYDRAAYPAFFLTRLRGIARTHRLTVLAVSIRKTRHGWHVAVMVSQRVAAARLVLIQALLGSDWKRELFNSRRAMAWRHIPRFWRGRANVLYERHYRLGELPQ